MEKFHCKSLRRTKMNELNFRCVFIAYIFTHFLRSGHLEVFFIVFNVAFIHLLNHDIFILLTKYI